MRSRRCLDCGLCGLLRTHKITGNKMSALKRGKQRAGAPIGCKTVTTYASTKTELESSRATSRPVKEPGAPNKTKSVKPRTVSRRQLEREKIKANKEGHPSLEVIEYNRPMVREECRSTARPCLYVSCSHHLYLDVTEKGSIVFNHPDKEPWELEETCSLDVAEKEDGQTLEEIGDILNLTRERVRQVERSALDKLKAGGKVER